MTKAKSVLAAATLLLTSSPLRLECYAAQGRDAFAVLGDQHRLQRISIVPGPVEHFERACDVKQVDTLIDRDFEFHG